MEGWKRPLIVGASGQVGTALYQSLQKGHGDASVIRSSRAAHPGWLQLDLAHLPGSVDAYATLDAARPDLFLCVGGMTFVDGCERSPEECQGANERGPAALAAYAHRRGAPFVFFSTDYVFSGTAATPGPYEESAPTNPLNAYGRFKLSGEQAVMAAHPGALIVRTTVVYGADAAAKNFLYTLLRHLATGQPLRVPVDQISTPTFNRDLAEATLALVSAGAGGVVHVAGPELMERREFAHTVAQFFGLDDSGVEGVSTASLGQAAARPLHSGLRTLRLQQLLPHFRPHTVTQALAQVEPEMRSFLSTLARP